MLVVPVGGLVGILRVSALQLDGLVRPPRWHLLDVRGPCRHVADWELIKLWLQQSVQGQSQASGEVRQVWQI